jgi:hypothetical protein
MNDQRAASAPGKALGAPSKSFGAGAWAGRRSPPCSPGVLGFGLSLSSEGRAGRLNPGHWLRDEPNAARQSRLNTTDASQPVMRAIMAVTTP